MYPAKVGQFTIIEDDVVFGKNVTIGSYCHIMPGTRIGDNTIIMDYVKLMPKTVIGCDCKLDDYVTTSGEVKIGDRIRVKRCTMIGAATEIESDAWIGSCVKTTKIKYPKVIGEEEETIEWIKICKGAMIGSGSLLLAGITIGEGAVVAAGAIVAKDCEPYGIYKSKRAILTGYRNV